MQTHRIKEMQIEAQASNRKAASALQKQLSFWVHTRAFQECMQLSLDAVVDEKTYLWIDTLELDIDASNQASFIQNFSKALLKALENAKQEHQLKNGQGAKMISKAEWQRELFLHFLQNGTFPADTPLELIVAIRTQLKAFPTIESSIAQAIIQLKASDNILFWTRLFYMFSLEKLLHFLQQYWAFSPAFRQKIKSLLEGEASSITIKSSFKNTGGTITIKQQLKNFIQLIQQLQAGQQEAEILHALQQQINAKPSLENIAYQKQDTNVEAFLEASNSKTDTTAQLVTGAGLVLLWTRFRRLLKQLEWIESKTFVDENAQQKAILWMHYLVHGQVDEIWEDDLLLPKVLCGWSVAEPVNTQLELEEAAFQAADMLLEKLLLDWMPNKTFSKDWLRTQFLRRTAIIKQRIDGAWQLHVPQKTEDILLNRLPSDISYAVIRYSWMEGLLFVEWK